MIARPHGLCLALLLVWTGAIGAAEKAPAFEDVIRHCQAGLCQEAGVQKEIKVSDDQAAKIAAALKPVSLEYVKSLEKLQTLKAEELPGAFQKLAAETRAKATKAALETLDAKQTARLRQIDLQQSGPAAFEDDAVKAALKLTAEQAKKLDGLKLEYEVKIRRFRRELWGGASTKFIPDTELPLSGQELLTGKTYPMLKKEYALAAKNVLTNDQLNKWYDLIGDIFPNPVPPRK